MKSLIKAYWNLLVPRVPESNPKLDEVQIRKIVKEVARGNTSLQVGKYATQNARKLQKERIIKHSFI